MASTSVSKTKAVSNVQPKVERELIIKSGSECVEIALVEDRKLVELHHEQLDSEFSVGDIFLGKVRKVSPGLNAAFVDIGHEKEAFLHYTDLGPQLRSMIKYTNGAINGTFKTSSLDKFPVEADIDKDGKINAVFQGKQLMLFQIMKEPISTKGSRITSSINLPGRYMVLSPFGSKVNISKRIADIEERQRLKEIFKGILPKNFGIIVRTAAENQSAKDIIEEMNHLLGRWDEIFKQLHKAKAPLKLLSELDKSSSLLRDLLSSDFNKVVVDNQETYQNIKTYLEAIAPEHTEILSLYKGSKDVFAANGIQKQIQASFGKTVTVASGAYLVIESTEAMHVVDVNSGNKVGNNHTDTLLKVNVDAAREIARQLRLRDIGGLIVIDFIDMKSVEHRQHLHREMKKFMSGDRAQHSILPLSKFGLMQITRQRVRPAIKLNTAEICPTCHGSGEVNPTELIIDKIEAELVNLINSWPKSKLSVHVHPFVHAYLTKGIPSKQHRWFWKHQVWLKVVSASNYSMSEYTFYDHKNDEIRLNEV